MKSLVWRGLGVVVLAVVLLGALLAGVVVPVPVFGVAVEFCEGFGVGRYLSGT